LTTRAGDGGRRSRRGFRYQDAATLLDCIELTTGLFDEVRFEDDDDIVCVSGGHSTFRQVKTKEDTTRHSVATVCRPEIKDQPESSILGRLFSGKTLTDKSRFCLVLNETPVADLNAFRIERGQVRGTVADEHCRAIREKLIALALPKNMQLSWFVDRFEVIVDARTIDQVEREILTRLGKPVTETLGQEPLIRELEEVLVRLMTLIARDAEAVVAKAWDAAVFVDALAAATVAATGRRPDGTTEPLQTLVSKLVPAGLAREEVTAQHDLMLSYRRRYRSAVGSERAGFDSLNDHVFAICTEISALRRAGEIGEGAPAYAETVKAINVRPLVPSRDVSAADRLAALTDVTARCENRYVS
jgi:hypothetical protein